MKNLAFTILIKIQGRKKEFNFRRRSENNYDVDTNTDQGDRIQFKMEKDKGNWVLIDKKLPEWLLENELALHNAIASEDQQM